MDHDSKDINFKKQRKIEDKSSLQKKKKYIEDKSYGQSWFGKIPNRKEKIIKTEKGKKLGSQAYITFCNIFFSQAYIPFLKRRGGSILV